MTEWQPIETAPKLGEFLAWHEGFKEIRQVRRFDLTNPNAVVNGPSGHSFTAKWWMPLPEPPAPSIAKAEPRHENVLRNFASHLMGWLIFVLYLFGETIPSNKFWRQQRNLRTINRK